MKNFEDKVPDNTKLATNTTFNSKIDYVKGKIFSIINLATTNIALTIVENKISNVSSFVKKKIMIQKYLTWKKVFYLKKRLVN